MAFWETQSSSFEKAHRCGSVQQIGIRKLRQAGFSKVQFAVARHSGFRSLLA
jgi:hypothetical protein